MSGRPEWRFEKSTNRKTLLRALLVSLVARRARGKWGRRMTVALRHQCRQCRTKLKEPTENLRRAFCIRGCFNSFYRSRCRVCECKITRKSERQKVCFGTECKRELRRFPEAYSWPEAPGPFLSVAGHSCPSDVRRTQEVPISCGSNRAIS